MTTHTDSWQEKGIDTVEGKFDSGWRDVTNWFSKRPGPGDQTRKWPSDASLTQPFIDRGSELGETEEGFYNRTWSAPVKAFHSQHIRDTIKAGEGFKLTRFEATDLRKDGLNGSLTLDATSDVLTFDILGRHFRAVHWEIQCWRIKVSE